METQYNQCVWYHEYQNKQISTKDFYGHIIAMCDLCDGRRETAKDIRCDKYMQSPKQLQLNLEERL